ncbi:MAG: YncE family protein [Mycobacterium sp.]
MTGVARIAVRRGPIGGIAAGSDGRRLVVTNCADHSVSVIDIDTAAVMETLTGTAEPFAVAIGAARGGTARAYVSTATAAYDAIAVISLRTNTVIATHPVALHVNDLAVSRSGKRVYASRTGADRADVAMLDTTSGRVDAFDIATTPDATAGHLCLSTNGRQLYLATQRPSGAALAVVGIRAERVLNLIEIGFCIRDVALSPDGRQAYVAGWDPGFGATVKTIDTRAGVVTGTVKLGGFLTGMTLSGDGERAYLVTGDGVTVLCTRTQQIIGTIAAGPAPSCVAESPGGDRFYVADYGGAVTVVSITALKQPFNVTPMDLDKRGPMPHSKNRKDY